MQWLTQLIVLTAVYPWLYIFGLYITWGSAWSTLGYIPRPSRDDPKDISTIASLYSGTALIGQLLVVALAILILALIAQGLIMGRKQPRRYAKLWGMAILFWVSATLLLFWDPLKAWSWLLD